MKIGTVTGTVADPSKARVARSQRGSCKSSDGEAAELDVQNLADRAFVYNFGKPFSGTHFGYPPCTADG